MTRIGRNILLMLAISGAGVLLFRAVLDHFDRAYSVRDAELRYSAWLRPLGPPPPGDLGGSRVRLHAENLADPKGPQFLSAPWVRETERAGKTYRISVLESPHVVRRRAGLSLFGLLLGPIFLISQAWIGRQRELRRLGLENARLVTAQCELEDVQRTLKAMLNYRDRERRLVANEIHDGFMQEIMSARMFLEGLAARLPEDDKVANEQLNNAIQLVDSAVGEGRQLVGELRPSKIASQGLIPALQRLVAVEEKRFGLSVAFRYPPGLDRDPISVPLQHTLYRIAQEALSNIRRHSGASEALIALQFDDNSVTLEIIDHGCGFQSSEMQESNFGLRGIHERTRLYGGQAVIRSKPGEGTSVTVRLPVDATGAEQASLDRVAQTR